jgi:regulator of protease activity HflC (stomatin/prohibitin superfamily)
MEAAFAWIGYLFEWLGRFIPRVQIIRATHAGVRFRNGKTAREIKPGLCIYFPLTTEVDIIPVARQTQNLPSQSLLTKDGKQVVVGGVVVYSIRDIVAALSKNWDIADTINDITMVAITQVVTSHTLEHLLSKLTEEVQTELTRVTRKKLAVYGVKVYRTALTDFATCLIINQVGNTNGGTIFTPAA